MSESIHSHRFAHTRRRAAIAAFVALGLTAGFVGGRTMPTVSAQATSQTPPDRPAPVRGVGTQTSYSQIVDRVAPSVVTVRVETKVAAVPTGLPESFRDFFGRQAPEGPRSPRAYRQGGLGSGVVIRNDGFVLTNAHVVADAERVRVEFTDKRSFDAKVVGVDAASDLAVLKIDARELSAVEIGDSDQVKVGDVVLAFGNPLGIGQTVTMGIVGAKGRMTGVGDGSYEDFIQTDAPINQGNSGGALVNLRGELIGINAQILSPSGGNIGLGFAIPSAMVRAVTDQLMRDGVVHRSRLGVIVQPVTADLAASLGLKDVRGALVSDVEPDSPAARAGLKQGDVITGLEGRAISDANAMRNQIAGVRPGSTVSLSVVRDGREQRIPARLVERAADKAPEPVRTLGQGQDGNTSLGVTVQPLAPQAAARMGLPRTTTGLVITEVDPAGAAADVGIQQGDVITRVNNKEVRTAADLQAAVAERADRPTLLLVTRDRTSLFVALQPRS